MQYCDIFLMFIQKVWILVRTTSVLKKVFTIFFIKSRTIDIHQYYMNMIKVVFDEV